LWASSSEAPLLVDTLALVHLEQPRQELRPGLAALDQTHLGHEVDRQDQPDEDGHDRDRVLSGPGLFSNSPSKEADPRYRISSR